MDSAGAEGGTKGIMSDAKSLARRKQCMNSTLEIEGMTCPTCAEKVEQAISKMPGVASATANFGTGKLRIVHDPKQISLKSIIEKVKDLGHEATAPFKETVVVTSVLKVGAMDCPTCAEKIQQAIVSMPGVEDVAVNFGAGKLRVIHNPEQAPLQHIVRVVSQMGHPATILSVGRVSQGPAWWKQPRIILLFVATILTVFGLICEFTHVELPETLIKVIYGIAAVVGVIYPAKSGWVSLKQRRLTLNALLVGAVVGAMYLGLWEEAALLVVIFSLGEVLESYAVNKARGSIQALVELAPREATVRRDGREVRVSTEEIQVEEVILVRPGEKIPVDGEIIAGQSAVDQSPITGESISVEKMPGSKVYASTLNGRGALEIRVTKLAQDSTLAKIIHLVEEAQTKKSNAQRFSEGFGHVYTPLMFALAILLAAIPPLFFGQYFETWFYRALVVLVVSCSCSLVLSVPVAIITSVGNAAKHGILVKGGLYMENAGTVQVVAFDKTGTLTIGRPVVTDIIPDPGTSVEELLRIAGALESCSEHPLAEAILRVASEQKIVFPSVESFTAIAGRGAQGAVDGKTYYVGNPRLFKELGLVLDTHRNDIERFQREGKTTMIVGDETQVLGIIAAADQPKDNAGAAIQLLKAAGVKLVVMLTGDNRITGEAIGRSLGVDKVRAELLPEDKIEVVRSLQDQYGMVCMVGDGINDAPALAQADVGVAMGVAGTDVAIETADIALMADDLHQLVYMVELSRRTVAIIKQNIAFSLATVALLVSSALLGWMSLSMGVLLNEGSAIVIITNGLRLLRPQLNVHKKQPRSLG